MKRIFLSLLFVPLSLFVNSCSDKTAGSTRSTNMASQYAGSYIGTLPCADCEGINTELMLHKDKTYSLTLNYIGRPVDPVQETGTYNWNKTGDLLTLISSNNIITTYKVGPNTLTQLDREGRAIDGNLADKYVLVKQGSGKSNTPLLETYWKLVEINGQPVPSVSDETRQMYITLKKKDHKVQGFAGCNSFSGNYELAGGNALHFSKMATTLMACPDMKTEDGFKRALEMTDNYTISGQYLSLNKAKMAPLARFVAVYPK